MGSVVSSNTDAAQALLSLAMRDNSASSSASEEQNIPHHNQPHIHNQTQSTHTDVNDTLAAISQDFDPSYQQASFSPNTAKIYSSIGAEPNLQGSAFDSTASSIAQQAAAAYPEFMGESAFTNALVHYEATTSPYESANLATVEVNQEASAYASLELDHGEFGLGYYPKSYTKIDDLSSFAEPAWQASSSIFTQPATNPLTSSGNPKKRKKMSSSTSSSSTLISTSGALHSTHPAPSVQPFTTAAQLPKKHTSSDGTGTKKFKTVCAALFGSITRKALYTAFGEADFNVLHSGKVHDMKDHIVSNYDRNVIQNVAENLGNLSQLLQDHLNNSSVSKKPPAKASAPKKVPANPPLLLPPKKRGREAGPTDVSTNLLTMGTEVASTPLSVEPTPPSSLIFQCDPKTKLFRCPVTSCAFTSSRLFNVKDHYLSHLGKEAKVLECKYCKMKFRRRYDATRHVKAKHKEEWEKVGEDAIRLTQQPEFITTSLIVESMDMSHDYVPSSPNAGPTPESSNPVSPKLIGYGGSEVQLQSTHLPHLSKSSGDSTPHTNSTPTTPAEQAPDSGVLPKGRRGRQRKLPAPAAAPTPVPEPSVSTEVAFKPPAAKKPRKFLKLVEPEVTQINVGVDLPVVKYTAPPPTTTTELIHSSTHPPSTGIQPDAAQTLSSFLALPASTVHETRSTPPTTTLLPPKPPSHPILKPATTSLMNAVLEKAFKPKSNRGRPRKPPGAPPVQYKKRTRGKESLEDREKKAKEIEIDMLERAMAILNGDTDHLIAGDKIALPPVGTASMDVGDLGDASPQAAAKVIEPVQDFVGMLEQASTDEAYGGSQEIQDLSIHVDDGEVSLPEETPDEDHRLDLDIFD
ncbi:hypothetical protein HDV05_005013 [Chytridiales sp. JEL 0842]|nr:hypothetical protein HDV05_005013 [Chytridiales sp. JEL 0842]